MRSCACDWAFIIQKSAECKNSSVFWIWAILSQKPSPGSFYSSLTASAVRMQQAMSIADNAEVHWWHDASRVSILTSCTMFMHNNTELGTSMFCLFLTRAACDRKMWATACITVSTNTTTFKASGRILLPLQRLKASVVSICQTECQCCFHKYFIHWSSQHTQYQLGLMEISREAN